MLKVLRYLDRKQWGQVAAALVFIVVQVWLDLTLPDYMSEITTLVETPGSEMSEILVQGGLMLACAVGSMAASCVVAYYAARVGAGLSRTLRGKVFDKTLELSKGDVEHFSTASLVTRSTNDITQIQSLIVMGLQAIVKAPIMAVWAVCKIWNKGWQWSAATAVAVFVVICMLAITLIVAVPRFRSIQGLTDRLNTLCREHLVGIRPVHAYNAEDYEQARFADANTEITNNNLVANRTMAMMSPGMTFVNSALTLAVYWIGAYMISAAGMDSRLTIFSDMVVFSNYAMNVIMAFVLLNMVFILLPRAQVSARRVCEVIDTASSVTDGKGADVAEEDKGTIEFRDVSFSYPDGGGHVLSHVSFTAEKGSYVAFIGATGSGKTSLVQLVDRLYDATEGEVLVDGIDVRDYELADLHDRIGYIPQSATLFSGTVESNIAYGEAAQPCTDDDVTNALEIGQASDFVEAMGGISAQIDQGGRNVSGGQRQRLAISRAIARKPETLVFDDSFSALDYATDRALRGALEERCAGTTRLVVAQRIGTIRDADKIIVLDQGRVVGQGTHDELMKTCETYQEIATSQLSKEELENA
ncbi:MAG: ABC transporter ATP-binding protein/permease [Atopobiaceae bacterium]|jgi:ATP-binding cassette subfamily B protein|nr:ABC transporter ATP-binding protein/permease [Atopobiaceae bacterium]MCI2173982.1 ABC transporter ATP-binding protein/permease [Atopobiaceae bacterium]MCI2207928.1 ABC transporter ATP-binding protein/permease [Atopobiaceae bacterium]